MSGSHQTPVMLIKVLGSAAGGGLAAVELQRAKFGRRAQGGAGLKARTQASVAVSANGRDWVLLNASPDLRQQINETPENVAVQSRYYTANPDTKSKTASR